MLEEKQLFTVLSNDDLEQISGGFNPVKYGKYVINEFVKGFRQAWQVVEVNKQSQSDMGFVYAYPDDKEMKAAKEQERT